MTEQRFRLVGDADMVAAPEIAEDLDKDQACGDDIVIDCIGLEFIDSSGISVLIDVWNTLTDRAGRCGS